MADGLLGWAVDHFATYTATYKEYKSYYHGSHRSVLDKEDEVKVKIASIFRVLRDNLCKKIVNTVSDRLVITGFAGPENDQEVQDYLTQTWKRLRLNTTIATIHRRAVREGDAYVIVWPDLSTGRSTIYTQDTWNIAVRYGDDANGVPEEALKTWESRDAQGKTIRRVTRYFADRIERYYIDGQDLGLPEDLAALKPYQEDGQPIVENPYGRVPVFRFANSLDWDVYAQSELTDVISQQDLLNKTILDLAVAAEYQGFQQRWATGLDIPIDPETGKPIEPFKAAASRVWSFASENVKLGQFEPADLSRLLAMIADIRTEMARITDTPLHLMMLQTGDFPSGEALKTAEAPLLTKVQNRQEWFGDTWEDIVSFAALIDNVALAPEDVVVQWKDITPHSETEQVNNASTKTTTLGVSKRQALRELGYTDEQIDAMFEERRTEATEAAEQLMTGFNAGPGNSGEE